MGDRTDFLFIIKDMIVVAVLNAGDGGNDGGGAAGSSFAEFVQFINTDLGFLGLHAQDVFGQIQAGVLGDTGQNGGRLRCFQRLAVFGEGQEIGRTDFFNIAMMDGV